MKYQIALTMKEIMLKNGRNTVWYGDLELIEECAELSGVKIQHPQKTIKYILDNLDRSPCNYFREDSRYIAIQINSQVIKYIKT